MKDLKLILAILTVESSYAKSIEKPVNKVPDTVQFCLSSESQWRIRTYAIDHDIHLYNFEPSEGEKILDEYRAVSNIQASYFDVISQIVTLEITDTDNKEEIQKELLKNKLQGKIEIVPFGLVFYNPDKARYRTKSTPKN